MLCDTFYHAFAKPLLLFYFFSQHDYREVSFRWSSQKFKVCDYCVCLFVVFFCILSICQGEQ